MLRQQTYKAIPPVHDSNPLSTIMANVLDHADFEASSKTEWTGHAFQERQSCLFHL